MPIKKYYPEKIIKLLRLVEIETGRGQTTAQACKKLVAELSLDKDILNEALKGNY